jgi:hypothetical protein
MERFLQIVLTAGENAKYIVDLGKSTPILGFFC